MNDSRRALGHPAHVRLVYQARLLMLWLVACLFMHSPSFVCVGLRSAVDALASASHQLRSSQNLFILFGQPVPVSMKLPEHQKPRTVRQHIRSARAPRARRARPRARSRFPVFWEFQSERSACAQLARAPLPPPVSPVILHGCTKPFVLIQLELVCERKPVRACVSRCERVGVLQGRRPPICPVSMASQTKGK